jgi:menaquinone-dependent protoporphyrinogen oxidase
MSRILIAYGTTDGHTRKVISHIAGRLREQGHEALAFDTAAVPRRFDASKIGVFILAGSVRWNRLQRSLVEFVLENASVLRHAPSVLIPVCFAAHSDSEAAQRALGAVIDAFAKKTGWTPDRVIPVSGALPYSQFGFFTRVLMKRLSGKYGYPSDTSVDHEFEEWDRLDAAVDSFVADAVTEGSVIRT